MTIQQETTQDILTRGIPLMTDDELMMLANRAATLDIIRKIMAEVAEREAKATEHYSHAVSAARRQGMTQILNTLIAHDEASAEISRRAALRENGNTEQE